ncbi:unnamed protein product [Mesocestoides corti]|uniref:Mediator of RNA polymerase II transcription subunit 6 n=1 Tax=Mesocestoides corti TaxID=53468 RepID=A0A0R3U5F6_MESCO|nr:unnamed protein product [Mesocestoides corti]
MLKGAVSATLAHFSTGNYFLTGDSHFWRHSSLPPTPFSLAPSLSLIAQNPGKKVIKIMTFAQPPTPPPSQFHSELFASPKTSGDYGKALPLQQLKDPNRGTLQQTEAQSVAFNALVLAIDALA